MTIKFGENQDVNVSNRINSEHLTIHSDLIYTDGTNVGIGTTNPNEKLHVAGNLNVNDGMILYSSLNNAFIANKYVLDNVINGGFSFFITSQGSIYLNKPSGQTLNILTNGNTSALVVSDDSVGIGLSPTQKLDVGGNIKLSGTLLLGTTPSSGTSGQLLVSKGSNNPPEWETITTGGGGASVLNDLNDVNTSGIANTHVLKYNNGFWENKPVYVNEINGIDLNLLVNNELLRKDGANNSVVGADIITSTATGGGVTSQKTTFVNSQPPVALQLSSIESVNNNGIYAMYLNPNEGNIEQKRMTINSILNDLLVGINTETPNEGLHLVGSFRIDNNTTQQIRFYDTHGGQTKESGTIKVDDNGGGADILFLTRPSGGSEPSEKMRIDKNGNVGIGTDNPTQKLEVNGNIKINHNILGTNNQIQIYSATNSDDSYSFMEMNTITTIGCPVFRIFTGSTDAIYGSERLRILSNGNVGIGTDNPTRKLEVDGECKLKDFVIGSLFGPEFMGIATENNFTNYNYALLQSNINGDTYINTPSGRTVSIRENNSNIATFNNNELRVYRPIRGLPGTIHKIHILPFTDGDSGTASSTTFVDIVSKTFFKTEGTNLYGEVNMNYELSGFGGDTFASRLVFYQVLPYFLVTGGNYKQNYTGAAGGGTRSSSLTDCVVYTDGAGVVAEQNVGIYLQIKRVSADDNVTCRHGVFKVTEIWT